jgi:hypothetical protein
MLFGVAELVNAVPPTHNDVVMGTDPSAESCVQAHVLAADTIAYWYLRTHTVTRTYAHTYAHAHRHTITHRVTQPRTHSVSRTYVSHTDGHTNADISGYGHLPGVHRRYPSGRK